MIDLPNDADDADEGAIIDHERLERIEADRDHDLKIAETMWRKMRSEDEELVEYFDQLFVVINEAYDREIEGSDDDE